MLAVERRHETQRSSFGRRHWSARQLLIQSLRSCSHHPYPGANQPNVPDPYYGGDGGFDEVHDIVERSCAALLDDLLARAAAAG